MENLSLVGGRQDFEIRRFGDRGASKWDGHDFENSIFEGWARIWVPMAFGKTCVSSRRNGDGRNFEY